MSTVEKKLMLHRSPFDVQELTSSPEQSAQEHTDAPPWLKWQWRRLKRWGFTHQDLLALLGLALFLNFWGITRGLPNVEDWDPDSIAPLGPLVYAKRLFYGEVWWEEYPPFHYMLLAAIMAPYVGLLWLTGGIHNPQDTYPYGLVQPEIALSNFILIARSVNALMGVGLVGIAYQVGRNIFDRRTGFLTGLLFACCPLSVYYAHTANLEVPYLFWSALAILSLTRLTRALATKHFVGLGVFTALAVATKDQAYGLFTLVPLALAVFCFRNQRQGSPNLFLRRAWYGLVGFSLVYLVASNIPWNLSGWIEHVHYIMGSGSARYQTYPNTIAGHFGLAFHAVAHLANALNVPIFLCCLTGLLYAKRNQHAFFSLVVPFFSYYLTFLSVVLYVYPRFIFPLIFLVLPLGGRVLSELWETQSKVARLFVGSVLVHAFAYGFFLDLQFTWDSRYEAEEWMRTNLRPGTVIGTDAQPAYLPRFPKDVKVVKISISKDQIHFEKETPPEYLVLSRAQYRRYRISDLTEPEQKLVAIMGGNSGYEVRAAFDTALDNEPFFAPRFLPYVSPTIIILQRISPDDMGSSFHSDSLEPSLGAEE